MSNSSFFLLHFSCAHVGIVLSTSLSPSPSKREILCHCWVCASIYWSFPRHLIEVDVGSRSFRPPYAPCFGWTRVWSLLELRYSRRRCDPPPWRLGNWAQRSVFLDAGGVERKWVGLGMFTTPTECIPTHPSKWKSTQIRYLPGC